MEPRRSGNVAFVLGEFFAAPTTSIDETLVEDGPFDRFKTVTAKTVSSVSIAALGEILGIGTNDEVYELVDQGRIAQHGEAGIDVVPEALRDRLASDDDLARVARRWHDTDEMRDWRPEDVAEVVTQLAGLARRAQAADEQLWFWWSL